MIKKEWKDIGLSVKDEVTRGHISLVSAGVAFYFFLALFPTLIAAVSIFGLIFDPAQIGHLMGEISRIFPRQATQIISDILKGIAGKADQTLGWGLALSLLFSFWTANKGTKAIFQGINIAYDEVDDRGFFKKNGITFLFTVGGIIIGIFCIALVVFFPAVVDRISMPFFLQSLLAWLRWPLMAAIIGGVLSVTYQIAPDRHKPELKGVSGAPL